MTEYHALVISTLMTIYDAFTEAIENEKNSRTLSDMERAYLMGCTSTCEGIKQAAEKIKAKAGFNE